MKKEIYNNNFVKLLNYDNKSLLNGGIFRCDATYPYEKKVDFMIFNNTINIKLGRKFGIMVSSGYKSGCCLVFLPNECLYSDGGISREWIILNWNKWVYNECSIENVLYSDGYKL